MRLVFGLASAFKNDAERESVRKRLASKVGVAAKVVEVGSCEEEAGGLHATAVTIGPLPTAQADDVTVQLRACMSDLAETGRLLKVDVQRSYVGVQIRSMPTFHFYVQVRPLVASAQT